MYHSPPSACCGTPQTWLPSCTQRAQTLPRQPQQPQQRQRQQQQQEQAHLAPHPQAMARPCAYQTALLVIRVWLLPAVLGRTSSSREYNMTSLSGCCLERCRHAPVHCHVELCSTVQACVCVDTSIYCWAIHTMLAAGLRDEFIALACSTAGDRWPCSTIRPMQKVERMVNGQWTHTCTMHVK